LELAAERLCRYFHAGQVIQLVSPGRATFAEVLACAPGRITARAESAAPSAKRVLVRAPVRSALFEASARLTRAANAEQTVILETFANMQCTERRACPRLDEPVPTHVYRYDGDEAFHRIAAVNLGATGLLLGWPDTPDLALGERVRLEIALDGRLLPASGQVVRLDGCRSAIHFLQISGEDQDRIAGYVFRREVAS
jgi:hypothetical protein